MRFRVRTIMIAVVIVGLATAFAVLYWRARDEIRRAHVELAVAKDRAVLAELQTKLAEARAKSAELRAKDALQQSSHVDGVRDTSQKPPSRRSSVAQ